MFLLLYAVLCSVRGAEVTTSVGNNVTLPCSVNFDYPAWVNTSLGRSFNFGGYSIFKASLGDLVERLAWANDNRSLIIREVRFTDAVRYQCFYSSDNQEFVSLVVRGEQKMLNIN